MNYQHKLVIKVGYPQISIGFNSVKAAAEAYTLLQGATILSEEYTGGSGFVDVEQGEAKIMLVSGETYTKAEVEVIKQANADEAAAKKLEKEKAEQAELESAEKVDGFEDPF